MSLHLWGGIKFMMSLGVWECCLFNIRSFSDHHQGSTHTCEDCHSSCLDCWGPGLTNCTMCPTQAILEAGGRCLLCCSDEGEEDTSQRQECCNCTETRGRLYVGFLLCQVSPGFRFLFNHYCKYWVQSQLGLTFT